MSWTGNCCGEPWRGHCGRQSKFMRGVSGQRTHARTAQRECPRTKSTYFGGAAVDTGQGTFHCGRHAVGHGLTAGIHEGLATMLATLWNRAGEGGENHRYGLRQLLAQALQ